MALHRGRGVSGCRERNSAMRFELGLLKQPKALEERELTRVFIR
jgi:hypothetical protein